MDAEPGTGTPDLHVDGGDLGCARLLVLLRERVRDLPDGALVHLTTRDPVAPIDLPVWCRLTGHEYLGEVPCAGTTDGGQTYALRVSATARATRADSPWHLADRGPAS